MPQARTCGRRRLCASTGEAKLFLSHFTKTIDAKGRLSLPAPFRAVLAKDEGVFIHPALDAPALDGGGSRLLSEIEKLLATMPAYSPDREDFSLALLGTSEMLKLDTEGRIFLGERLRASIGLKQEAVFVGQGDKFQIWAAEAFAERLEAARVRARDIRAKLAKAPA